MGVNIGKNAEARTIADIKGAIELLVTEVVRLDSEIESLKKK